ncbi:hypothetical protein N2152v2_009103 [Parachlorella kessleri]
MLRARPDGSAVLAASDASTLWLLHDKSAEVLLCGHQHPTSGMQHSPGLLATSSMAGLHIWPVNEQGSNARAPLVEFFCPADGTVFALLGAQHVVVCKASWAKHSACQTLARFEPSGQDTAGAAIQPRLPSAAFSAAHPGHIYCSFPGQPACIQLYDYTDGSLVKTISVAAASGEVTALAVAPGDRLLAAGTSRGTVLLMRGDTEAWCEVGNQGAVVRGLAFSRCGSKLFSVAGKNIVVMDVK